jgi:hypothetical protein
MPADPMPYCPFLHSVDARDVLASAILGPGPVEYRSILRQPDCRCTRCTIVRDAHAETLRIVRAMQAMPTEPACETCGDPECSYADYRDCRDARDCADRAALDSAARCADRIDAYLSTVRESTRTGIVGASPAVVPCPVCGLRDVPGRGAAPNAPGYGPFACDRCSDTHLAAGGCGGCGATADARPCSCDDGERCAACAACGEPATDYYCDACGGAPRA